MSPIHQPKKRTRSFLLLVVLAFGGTLQADPPELRHLNYLVLQAQRGDEIQIELLSIAHGIQASEERLKWRLLKPDGYTVATGEENLALYLRPRLRPTAREQSRADLNDR